MMPGAWNGHPRSAASSRAIGLAIMAFSLLRWPLTALLVSPAWGSPGVQWVLILAVQASAETMFWIGAWMAGREHLRAALVRVAQWSPLRTVLSRGGARDARRVGEARRT